MAVIGEKVLCRRNTFNAPGQPFTISYTLTYYTSDPLDLRGWQAVAGDVDIVGAEGFRVGVINFHGRAKDQAGGCLAIQDINTDTRASIASFTNNTQIGQMYRRFLMYYSGFFRLTPLFHMLFNKIHSLDDRSFL